MTPRSLHQLPPVIWVVTLEITDTPAPGESYLDATEIQAGVIGALKMPIGLGATVKQIIEPTREF
jgi:hypothetical protein